jgi:hypothetical protein
MPRDRRPRAGALLALGELDVGLHHEAGEVLEAVGMRKPSLWTAFRRISPKVVSVGRYLGSMSTRQ